MGTKSPHLANLHPLYKKMRFRCLKLGPSHAGDLLSGPSSTAYSRLLQDTSIYITSGLTSVTVKMITSSHSTAMRFVKGKAITPLFSTYALHFSKKNSTTRINNNHCHHIEKITITNQKYHSAECTGVGITHAGLRWQKAQSWGGEQGPTRGTSDSLFTWDLHFARDCVCCLRSCCKRLSLQSRMMRENGERGAWDEKAVLPQWVQSRAH